MAPRMASSPRYASTTSDTGRGKDGGGNGTVQLLRGWEERIRGKACQYLAAGVSEEREAVSDQARRFAGVHHDQARQGVQGANLRPVRPAGHEPKHGLNSAAQLRRRVPVERHHQDARGRNAGGDQDSDPGHQRRRLAAPGGRDDLGRTRAQAGRRSLTHIEPGEHLVHAHLHRPRLVPAMYQGVIGEFPRLTGRGAILPGARMLEIPLDLTRR